MTRRIATTTAKMGVRHTSSRLGLPLQSRHNHLVRFQIALAWVWSWQLVVHVAAVMVTGSSVFAVTSALITMGTLSVDAINWIDSR